jgi:hypothetical protein
MKFVVLLTFTFALVSYTSAVNTYGKNLDEGYQSDGATAETSMQPHAYGPNLVKGNFHGSSLSSFSEQITVGKNGTYKLSVEMKAGCKKGKVEIKISGGSGRRRTVPVPGHKFVWRRINSRGGLKANERVTISIEAKTAECEPLVKQVLFQQVIRVKVVQTEQQTCIFLPIHTSHSPVPIHPTLHTTNSLCHRPQPQP